MPRPAGNATLRPMGLRLADLVLNALLAAGRSFIHAWHGLIHTIVHQRNMRVHLVAATLVGFVGSGIPLGLAEKVTLIFCVLLVLFAEILNSALEALVDLATEQLHDRARITKDTAAAGVLVLALGTVVVFAALLVHNWPVVVASQDRVWRQLGLGIPVAGCVAGLVWPRRPSAAVDLLLFGLATGLLAIQFKDTASTVFSAMTFGVVVLAAASARARRRASLPSSKGPTSGESSSPTP